MTDSDRSPFRRQAHQGLTESGADAPGFPWVQLVFFLACLAMAAWTWMRYSYAWPVAPSDVVLKDVREPLNPWSESYVTIRGDTLLHEVVTPAPDWPVEPWAVIAEREVSGAPTSRQWHSWVRLENSSEIIQLYREKGTELRVIADDERTGRFSWEPGYSPWDVRVNFYDPYYHASLKLSASRFHPASVAGIVVGAMGAFIFGLYLRRWLRERAPCHGHAPASAPGQDSPA